MIVNVTPFMHRAETFDVLVATPRLLLNISAICIGPVSFAVNAGDKLTTATPGNHVHKYADDIVIPACNAQSSADELEHVALWAQAKSEA